jgi:isoleucyl-tRNA synthetase
LAIRVDSAEGDKCERCWVHDISVGSDIERPTICSRCQDSLSRISPD